MGNERFWPPKMLLVALVTKYIHSFASSAHTVILGVGIKEAAVLTASVFTSPTDTSELQ
jgi:hypothetical protein